MAVLGEWLDLMILNAFSNLTVSMILWSAAVCEPAAQISHCSSEAHGAHSCAAGLDVRQEQAQVEALPRLHFRPKSVLDLSFEV